MYTLLEVQRIIYLLLAPFMPTTSAKALAYMGETGIPLEADLAWGKLQPGTAIAKAEALFPRIETKGE
jgi:methionyl-tRNA synthetase